MQQLIVLLEHIEIGNKTSKIVFYYFLNTFLLSKTTKCI